MINIIPRLLAFTASLVLGASAAGPKVKMPNPDFTKGEAIPEGASKDWNLGATGARGWMHSNKLATVEARQVYITKVAAGSPGSSADTIFKAQMNVGDSTKHPDLAGTVKAVDTRPFYRATRVSTTTAMRKPTCWSAKPWARPW